MLNYSDALADLFNRSSKPIYGKQWDDSKPTIAVVLDEFSTRCFEGIANLVPIGTQDIEKALDFFEPDLLLCESAWRGNNYSWRYRFARNSGPDPKVEELVHAARSRGIPSVFWNKEDPPHFDEFSETAALFDYIFTTEAGVVERYKTLTGRSNAYVLPFAAAPEIHTPRRGEGYRAGEVAFAGQYFAHKFPERRTQMEYLFPAAAKFKFDIYSREQNGDPNYQFPDRYQNLICGSLPYEEMVHAYRRYRIFLNVNSVPQSESMCARRIFELSACKTLVLSSPSNAISRFYSDGEVLQSATKERAIELLESAINDDYFHERTAHRAWRVTMRRHTYADRLEYILSVTTKSGGEIDSTAPSYDLHGPREFSYLAYVDLDTECSGEQDIERLIREISEQSVPPRGIIFGKGASAEADGPLLTRQAARQGLPAVELAGNEGTFAVSFTTGMSYGAGFAEDLFLCSRQQPEAFFGKTELFDGTRIAGCRPESTVPTVLRGTVAARRLEDLVRLYDSSSRGTRPMELPADGYSVDRFNCLATTSAILEDNDWKI
ncbi:glycosyltransferase [Zhihengliuella alba]|uniref:Glycosyltransferase n=1 Tax=Zhihengliuella alba TaxID=547018 RepID=A0ABP7CQG6_9MICC